MLFSCSCSSSSSFPLLLIIIMWNIQFLIMSKPKLWLTTAALFVLNSSCTQSHSQTSSCSGFPEEVEDVGKCRKWHFCWLTFKVPAVYVFRFTHRMAGTAHSVMRLLLLSLIRTGKRNTNTISSRRLSFSVSSWPCLLSSGVKGADGLTVAERGYDITFPCEEDSVCFHIWHFSTSGTSDYIAIVSNGEIQTAKSEAEDSKCTLTIKDLTADDVGRHRCQQRSDVFSPRRGEYCQDFSFIAAWVDIDFISPDQRRRNMCHKDMNK